MIARAQARVSALPALVKVTLFAALTIATVTVLKQGTWAATIVAPQVTLAHFLGLASEQPAQPSVFETESAMSRRDLLDRWQPDVDEAAQRFNVPASWIRAVIARESGGRTLMGENLPITSDAGAAGLMQVMPETFDEMRTQYGLGQDVYDPHDNIIAGTAYLRWLYQRYGFPKMFAAYNDGPGNFDKHLAGKRGLPQETVAYLATLTSELGPLPRKHRLMRT
jgi:membrane-bound lytic murein transglycosylase B